MSKRFIDTELFNDSWFQELSLEGKLFFIYFITNCDHAGILKLNKRLFQFQTSITNVDSCINEIMSVLVIVRDDVYFMPKFLKFQYPGFPKSNVKQQQGAMKIINENNLNSYITVAKELANSYEYGNVIVNDNVKGGLGGKLLWRPHESGRYMISPSGNKIAVDYFVKNKMGDSEAQKIGLAMYEKLINETKD